MDNIARVLDHLGRKREAGDPTLGNMRPLELIKTVDGANFSVVDGEEYWRSYRYVDGAETIDDGASPSQVRHAAAGYGRFLRLLSDLPAPPLIETIPDFHDTGRRYAQFEATVAEDADGRAGDCAAEIEIARAESRLADAIAPRVVSGTLPRRTTHNDTKINNVMLDVETGEAVCVIDLDTVMPGTVLYDFGDLVRSATITAAEDERNAATVHVDLEVFAELADGFLSTTAGWLTDTELAGLNLCCQVMSYECGIRFLTDFLNGDAYFKTAYPTHNLVRCRTQFALLADMQRKTSEMQAILDRAAARYAADEQRREAR
jgi:hypothetical protein